MWQSSLCCNLCLFVVEACKTNGEPCPPKTVFDVLTGLLPYAHSGSVQECPNFLDPKDVRLKMLQGTGDSMVQASSTTHDTSVVHQPLLVQPEVTQPMCKYSTRHQFRTFREWVPQSLLLYTLMTCFWTHSWLLVTSSCRVGSFVVLCYLWVCLLKYFTDVVW